MDTTFHTGFNEVLVKLLRPADATPFDAHLILLDPLPVGLNGRKAKDEGGRMKAEG